MATLPTRTATSIGLRPTTRCTPFTTTSIGPIGTHLYGRRVYEMMVYWDAEAALENEPPVIQDYGKIWRADDKIVYFTSPNTVSSGKTRTERAFHPDAVLRLRAAAARDIGVGGSNLAAQAIRAGLVDEYHLLVTPFIVGSGKQCLPNDVRLKLELLDERWFANDDCVPPLSKWDANAASATALR